MLKQTAFNQKDSLTTGPKMSKGTRQTSLTQCLWTAWGERTAECGQAYVLSLNSMSYCFHWRQNAGPDGPCWDPLGYFLCFLILKKFWSSLFQKITNFDFGTEHQQFRTVFTDVSQARRTAHYHKRWAPTQKKTKHWHREIIRGKYLKLNPAAGERQGCCCSRPSCPTSREAQHVFPTGMCIQSTHVHTTHTYIYGWTDRSQRDTRSTHTNTRHLICSHTQNWPLETSKAILAPAHFTYLLSRPAWSLLTLTRSPTHPHSFQWLHRTPPYTHRE